MAVAFRPDDAARAAPGLPETRAGVDDAPALPSTRVTVRVPAQLRSLAGGRSAVQVDVTRGRAGGVTVGEALAALREPYPGVHDAALDERGVVRQHVNVFVGPENIAFGDGLATPIPPGAEIWVLPAVSGG